MSKGLFITGTGTDIGKTYVTGLIVKKLHEAGLRAAYYKAAMSGYVRDAEGYLIPGDVMQADNRRMCEEMTGIPVLAGIEKGATDLPLEVKALTALYE